MSGEIVVSPFISRFAPPPSLDKALAARRIQTQIRRDEISAAFVARRKWARERYESLPKSGNGAGLAGGG